MSLCKDSHPQLLKYRGSGKVCFEVFYNDVDIVWASILEKPLSAAIGSAKMEFYLYGEAELNERILLPDEWVATVKTKGEIYDFYDFNMNKNTFGLVDLNSDGAWVQMGYDPAYRSRGRIFITTVPFVDIPFPFDH